MFSFFQLGDEGPQKGDTFSIPLDNVFADYDDNNDDYIDLEEFYFTMTSDVPLENPDRLKEMFNAADIDGKLCYSKTCLKRPFHNRQNKDLNHCFVHKPSYVHFFLPNHVFNMAQITTVQRTRSQNLVCNSQ